MRLLDRLQKRGLTQRLASPTDRRSHALKLTASGQQLLKRAKALSPEAIRDAIVQTNYNSLVGPIQWKNGPVKNVCTTPRNG